MEEVEEHKKMQQAVEMAADARQQKAVNPEDMAAKIVEDSKHREEISSDMDDAARIAEEALKRLEGEM